MSQDPRVYFAAERTLLAWVRSGIALMAMGFVVAKFGLFIKMFTVASGLSGANEVATLFATKDYANSIGLVLVLIGVMVVFGAQYNHQYFIRSLPPEDIPNQPFRVLSHLMAYAIGLVGVLLAFYLHFL